MTEQSIQLHELSERIFQNATSANNIGQYLSGAHLLQLASQLLDISEEIRYLAIHIESNKTKELT